uniref:Transmembrane protein n=1 Tax=Strongyloides papillosus TaxID=174720 RepID=A0A0N5CH72_STREA
MMKSFIKITIFIQCLIVIVRSQQETENTNNFSYVNGELEVFNGVDGNCTDSKYIFITFLFNKLTYGQFNGCLDTGIKIINNAITSRLDILNVFSYIYDKNKQFFDIEKICLYEKNIKLTKLSLTGKMTMYLFCSVNKITDTSIQPCIKSPSHSMETVKCGSDDSNILCREGSCGMYQRIIFDRKKNVTFSAEKIMCTHQIISFLCIERQKYRSYVTFDQSIINASSKCANYENFLYLVIDRYYSFYWLIQCYNHSVNNFVFPNPPDLGNTNDLDGITNSGQSLLQEFYLDFFIKLPQTLILFTFLGFIIVLFDQL